MLAQACAVQVSCEWMDKVSSSLRIRVVYLLCWIMATTASVPSAINGTSAMAQAVDVETLVRSLGSPDCRARKAAVLEAWRNLVSEREPRRYLKSLRETVDESQGEVRRRLVLLAKDAEAEADFWETRWKELFFVERVRRARSREEQARRIEEARNLYLTIIRDPSESSIVRGNAAGEMLFAIDRFDQFSQEKRSPFPPGALRAWTSDVLGLLKSPDPTVRLIGACEVGARPGLPGRTVRKGVIIPVLLAGLRHSELSLRIRSQTTLEALTGRDSCLDPTDPDAEREPEIKAWESWWNIEKRKLARETLGP